MMRDKSEKKLEEFVDDIAVQLKSLTGNDVKWRIIYTANGYKEFLKNSQQEE